MTWTLSDIPSQKGKIVLITGATSGLGYVTSKVLLSKSATVLMGYKSEKKAAKAKKAILSMNLAGNVDFIYIDLSDIFSVNKTASRVIKEYGRISTLINNAGVMGIPESYSNQGIEMHFAANHLGHFALTKNLIPLLKKEPKARVVTITSGIQHFGRIDLSTIYQNSNYNRWDAYAQSKLANVMFALELEQKFKKDNLGILSLLAHPGIAKTNLQKKSLEMSKSKIEYTFYKILNPLFQSAENGALPQIYASTAPDVNSGDQYGPKYGFSGNPRKCQSAKKAFIVEDRKTLWDMSNNIIEKYTN
tara:strand:- start:901 stop:1812 length:912 start_codon:yes stop_codon:yes gene_type:complete